MDFAFSEDQLAFRDAVRDLLAGTCPPEAVRAAWDADDPWSDDRWAALVDMGVVGLTVPEADGGLGLTEVDLVLLLEEAGRAALPEPLVESALLGDGTQKVAAAPAGATHVAGAASADLVVVGTRTFAGVPDADPAAVGRRSPTPRPGRRPGGADRRGRRSLRPAGLRHGGDPASASPGTWSRSPSSTPRSASSSASPSAGSRP